MYQKSTPQDLVERVLRIFIAFDKWPQLARSSVWLNIAVYAFTATLVSVGLEFDGVQENLYEVCCMIIGGLSVLGGIHCLASKWFAPGLVLLVTGASTSYILPVYFI